MSIDVYKVLFTGPVGAGKTTAIRALSDNLPMMTDVAATDDTRLRKASTTVAMDFGVIRLGRHEAVHLYGTPGQERFDFMWEILQEGALGVLILVDDARPAPVADMVRFVSAYDSLIARTGVAVGVTRTDLTGRQDLAEYRAALGARVARCPVFSVDARNGRDVSLLLQALLFSIDPEVTAA